MPVSFVVTDVTLFNDDLYSSRILFHDVDANDNQVALLPLLGKTDDSLTRAKFRIADDQMNTGLPLHLEFEAFGTLLLRLTLRATSDPTLSEIRDILKTLRDQQAAGGPLPISNIKSRTSNADGSHLIEDEPKVGLQSTINFTLGKARFQLEFKNVLLV